MFFDSSEVVRAVHDNFIWFSSQFLLFDLWLLLEHVSSGASDLTVVRDTIWNVIELLFVGADEHFTSVLHFGVSLSSYLRPEAGIQFGRSVGAHLRSRSVFSVDRSLGNSGRSLFLCEYRLSRLSDGLFSLISF